MYKLAKLQHLAKNDQININYVAPLFLLSLCFIKTYLEILDLFNHCVRVSEVRLHHSSQNSLLLSEPIRKFGLLLGEVLPLQKEVL